MEADKTTSEASSEKEQDNEVDIVDVVNETDIEIEVKETVPEQNNCIEEENNEQIAEISKKQKDTNNKKLTIAHEEEEKPKEKTPGTSTTDELFDFLDISSVKLLQGAVSELERALRDSRGLIKSRDEEIVGFRKEIEKGREQVHKEQMKWQRKGAIVEERKREIQELKRKLRESERSNEELQERIKEFESPFSESDGVSSCCSSMKELIEVKLELAEKDLLVCEMRKNNVTEKSDTAIAVKDGWGTGPGLRTTAEECERHNQLKLKFLRDAFFYFMIDFHSEEQIKAILAVLAYGDQRENVIMQAFRMRQRGKKFSVKEVSSRGLSFLHEEI